MAARHAIRNSTRTALALLALIALLCSCGGGGGGPGPDPPEQRYTLSGRVLSGAAGVSGAQVLLALNQTVTDATGAFSYANLLPGNYTISLQDAAGNFDSRTVNLTAGATSFSFALPSDQGGFRVVEVEPPLGASNAALDSELRLRFNSNPLASSVSAADFRITPDIGEFSATVNGDEVILRPRLQLPAGQSLLIEVIGQISDTASRALAHPVRWRFRSANVDNAVPRLLETNPDFDSTSHPPNLAVALEFNEPLAALDSGFSLAVTPETELIPRVAGRLLFISPLGGWEPSTAYELSVSGLSDLAGNRNTDLIELSFTTGSTPAPSRDIQGDWNRNLDVIVFASDLLGNYDIYSIASDGSELIQHTFSPDDEMEPTLSRDGGLLAYQRRSPGGRWRVYAQSFDGGEPRPITSGSFNDTEPFFSRTTSDRIVYTSDATGTRSIFLMNSDGSNPLEQDFSFGGDERQPALHPLLDTQMLFASSASGNSDIWRKTVSAVDGSTINLNLTASELSDEHSPSWSPDADFIVFISDRSGVDSLWQADATGGFAQQVTFFELPLSWPQVSPFNGDPRAVASLDNAQGGRNLVILDLISGNVERTLTGTAAQN